MRLIRYELMDTNTYVHIHICCVFFMCVSNQGCSPRWTCQNQRRCCGCQATSGILATELVTSAMPTNRLGSKVYELWTSMNHSSSMWVLPDFFLKHFFDLKRTSLIWVTPSRSISLSLTISHCLTISPSPSSHLLISPSHHLTISIS